MAPPDAPHAALPDRFGQQVPPCYQHSRPTLHGRIIVEKSTKYSSAPSRVLRHSAPRLRGRRAVGQSANRSHIIR